MPLTMIGPGVQALQDYTPYIDATTIVVNAAQGDTLDTMKCVIHDSTNTASVVNEDDIMLLDETDPNGWPSVNQLLNPQFETTSGGLPTIWTYNTPSGGSFSSTTSTVLYGGRALQMSWSNMANSATLYASQIINTPTDEYGNIIIANPYAFSGYTNTTSAPVNTTVQFWVRFWSGLNGTGSVLSATNNIATILTGTNGGWSRSSLVCQPPAGALSMQVLLWAQTTNATNSGTIIWDGIQVEYAASYETAIGSTTTRLTNLLQNQFFEPPATSGAANGWGVSSATGVTPTNATPGKAGPGDYCQQITFSNGAASTYAHVLQGVTLWADENGNIFTNRPYIFSGWVLTNALSGIDFTTPQLVILWYTAPGGTQISSTVQMVNLNPTQPWTQYSISGYPPAGATFASVVFELSTDTTGTNSGYFQVDNFAFYRAYTFPSYGSNLPIYPTPFIDTTKGLGVGNAYVDANTGLAYRHLRLFAGYLRHTRTDFSQGPERNIECDAVDYSVMLAEAPATFVLNTIPDTQAIALAFQYAQQQGFLEGIDYTTNVTGLGNIASMTFNWTTTRDVMSKIADCTMAVYYVDYYKYLYYGPPLAATGGISASDTPDYVTSFPYSALTFDNDSTQAVTEPVIEGSTQLSLPQTYSTVGTVPTLAAALTSGTPYTSLSLNAGINTTLIAGTQLAIDTGATAETVTLSAQANSGATSLAINSFTPSNNHAINAPVAVFTFFMNAGNPIVQVDSATVAGSGITVGLYSVNTFAQGYNALLDPNTGQMYFPTGTVGTPPANNVAIVIIYRFAAPVLVRLRKPSAKKTFGRIIYSHSQDSNITAEQAAVDRANAALLQYSKPQPIGQLVFTTPPVPTAIPLRCGMAVSVQHHTIKYPPLNPPVLFQVQEMEIRPLGNGKIQRTLKLGFYVANFMITVSQQYRKIAQNSTASGSDILQDVLASADGWTMTDSAVPVLTNGGVYGTSVWGPASSPGVWV